jgi:protein O-GlcNAc transferase
MLRNLLKRLVPLASARVRSEDPAVEKADRLIAQGRRAEDAGSLSEACDRYREAVALAPQHAAAHLNLGVGLEVAGDADGALKCYEAVLAIDPGNAYANYNLGKLLFLTQQLDRAERHLRLAIARKPGFWEPHVVLANLLDARNDAAGAAVAFESAIQHGTQDFGAWLGYGLVLVKLKRKGEAEAALKRALTLDATSAEAHGTLSELYQERGDFAAAVPHIEAALEQRPDWPDGLNYYAFALARLHRFDEAWDALARAIALAPEREDLYLGQLSVLERGGRIREMLELARARRARAPDRRVYESTELFGINFVDDVTAEEVFTRHRIFGERLEKDVPQRFTSFGNDRDPGRRLRIGYVSGEFYLHPVARFMVPLLERHDRSEVQVHCYSVGVLPADSYTRQVEERSDVWRPAKAMNDTELADLVHRDQIDILVDLSGHSGTSRLGAFAQQPAPVQATWLGNLNTTGLTRIQYRITDSNCDPPGLTERLHTETLARLPGSQWCYRPYVAIDVPQKASIERGDGVTFGSFTQFPKLTVAMRSLWARILREVPGSRLMIAGVPQARVRDELLQALARCGVDAARVTLLPFMSLRDYLRAFGGVDIALDTSPYSGGTTTCDALWMGVPVLTLPGVRPASRSAASILTTMGLTDWVATSPEDYVRRAVRFASERETIAQLHRSLRDRMVASPLMDEARFARDVEQLYRMLWRRWCAGRPATQSG